MTAALLSPGDDAVALTVEAAILLQPTLPSKDWPTMPCRSRSSTRKVN